MLKRGKKIMATLLATVMFFSIALTASAACSYEIPIDYFDTGIVTLPSNSYHEYHFFAPTARTCIFAFSTNNPDIKAVLFSCDGNNNLLTDQLLFSDGSLSVITLPAGNWCIVVLPVFGTLGGQYRFIVNGSNPAGLTNISLNNDQYLANVSGTLNGVNYINGVAQSPPSSVNKVKITSYGGGYYVTYDRYMYRINENTDLTINGKVTDANGNPIVGEKVEAVLKTDAYFTGKKGSNYTDAYGNFTIVVRAPYSAAQEMWEGGSPYRFKYYYDIGELKVTCDGIIAYDEICVFSHSTPA